MNRKAQVLTLIISITLIATLYITVPTYAIIASNQLELIKGSYVEGRLFYSNSTVNNLLVSYPKISVEGNIEPFDISHQLIKVRYRVDFIPGVFNPLGNPYHDFIELTHVIFQHNRTTLLPAAKFATGNSTHYYEASVLEYNSVADMLNENNTKLTLNSTSYYWRDVTPTHPYYFELNDLMFTYFIVNFMNIRDYYKWTLLGISPTANVTDQINYVNTNTKTDALATVVAKTQISTLSGPIINATHVNYDYTSVFGWWDNPNVDAYYEEETGLLVQMKESDGVIEYEFLPTTVYIEELEPTNDTNGDDETDLDNTFTINNSILGILLGVSSLCISTILRRRKK
jgi:hypothetical protein